jgi:hypothetical protein
VLEVEVTSTNRGRITGELTTHGIEFLDVGNTIKVLGVAREQLPATLLGTTEELTLRPATLEDVFFHLTGKTMEEEEERE